MFKGIQSLSKLLARGDISVTEIQEAVISRAKEIKHLNAFVCHKELSENPPEDLATSPPLHGIPFAVKDNFSTVDFTTTCASQMLSHYQSPYNATVVEKLLRSGGFLVGKTNMDSFAMGTASVESTVGPLKNPWTPGIIGNPNLEDWKIAGGSSGGSAVSVATGACVFALGSDTGGSVRNPASYCGVVGFKPTYGLISRHGLIPLVNSMDVPGIFARTVEDASIVCDVLHGWDEMDSTTLDTRISGLGRSTDDIDIEGLRVGLPRECMAPGLSQEVIDTWKWAADEFENAGAVVEEIFLPHMKYSIVCYHILCCAEVASNMARFDGLKYGNQADVRDSTDSMFAISRKQGLNDTIRSRILTGNYFLLKKNQEKYYMQAKKVRNLIKQDYCDVFIANELSREHFGLTSTKKDGFKCDVILSPVVLSDAPRYSEFITEDNRTRSAEQDVLTQSVNMAGIPAITVPTRLSKAGLPIGLQIIGSYLSEPIVFKASNFLEKVANFPSLESKFTMNPL